MFRSVELVADKTNL